MRGSYYKPRDTERARVRRGEEPSLRTLQDQARARNIPYVYRMTKDELRSALGQR